MDSCAVCLLDLERKLLLYCGVQYSTASLSEGQDCGEY